MPSINRGSHFLLTKAVTITASENQLTEAVTYNVTAFVNRRIFRDGRVIVIASVNSVKP